MYRVQALESCVVSPEMHIKPEDIDSIVILQREIIDSSVKMVKDGGTTLHVDQ